MSSKIDPLAKLFSGARLSGLSNPNKETNATMEPLNFQIDETSFGDAQRHSPPKTPPRNEFYTEDTDSMVVDVEEDSDESHTQRNDVTDSVAPVVESVLAQPGVAQPGVAQPVVVEQEKTESSQTPPSSEKTAQMDVETRIKILKAKQAMELTRRKMQKEASQPSAPSSVSTQTNTVTTNSTHQAEKVSAEVSSRVAQIDKVTQPKQEKSAMEMFLEAANAHTSPPKNTPDLSNVSPNVVPHATKTTQKNTKTKEVLPVTPSNAVPPTEDNIAKTSKIPNKAIMANKLVLTVQSMIMERLPQLTEFHVVSAMDSFERPLLKAMWMTHKMKFLMQGKLEYAVAATSVIDSLETVEEGQLVAVYIETTASDYLIWMDTKEHRLIAAFANAGQYFA